LFNIQLTQIFVNYKVTAAGRQTIFAILRQLKAKNMTLLGKRRKQRVCIKLFDKRRETDLLTKTVLHVFPMFKDFILCFETKRPMIHKLHDKITMLFRKYLGLFIKAEDIRENGKQLAKLNLEDKTKHVPLKHVSIGECSQILSTCHESDVLQFKKRVFNAYLTTAGYMQKKLPLDHALLSTLSMLDPLAFGQTESSIILKKLPAFFPNIPVSTFDEEIMKMQYDVNILVGSEADLDEWWNSVFKLKAYPSVEKIVTACLSIFSGPRVEQSFSIMNNIITSKTSSLNLSTYEAILSTKYFLLAQNKTSIQLYERLDAVHSPVDLSLAWHLQTSHARYVKKLKTQRQEREAKDKQLGCKKRKAPSVSNKDNKRAKSQ